MGTPELASDRWQTLRRNPVTWIAGGAFAVVLVPYVIPILPPSVLAYFAEYYADFPLLLASVAAFQYRRGAIARHAERRFWDLWTLAFGCWLVVRVMYASVPLEYLVWWLDLVVDALYLLFYLCIVLALELRPDRPAPASLGTMRRRVEALGACVFLFALMFYFAIIPGMLSYEAYWTWVPSMLLYVTLDVFVVGRLLYLRHDARSKRWRTIYGLMALTVAMWALTDAYETLTYAEVATLLQPAGGPWDLVWYLPFVPITLAALLRSHEFPHTTPNQDAFAEGPEPHRGRGTMLLVYTGLLPAIHFLLYSTGIGDAGSRGPREVMALVAVIVLAGIALGWQRLLQWENRRLEAERQLNEQRRMETVRRFERERAEKERISEQRALEAQLQQAQKMEAVGQLSGGMAHDFNNILTVIMAHADLVDAALPPECFDQRSDLQELRAAARRGSVMVKRLLGFSRRALLSLRSVSLPELVESFLTTLRRLIPESIVIRYSAAEPVEPVLADPGAVEQIIVNLATNARDAMPDGGTLTVDVRAESLDERHRAVHGWGDPGDYVCLSVRDEGVGMDEETRRRVFEPFFTTKQPGEGTGLGMAMIYGLVKQHRGFAEVQSELGVGTVVKIYFPVAGARAGAAALEAPEGRLQGGSETVLLVEDEEPIRKATERVLTQYGYRVMAAADGDEALRIFESSEDEIDLVISDVVMPKMNGPDLYRAIRERKPAAKCILISGYADPARPRDQDESAVPLLAKPWTLGELLHQVRRTLDQR
ncbi:MAG: response regulator [Gemmatimonadales bacterium]|nr:response regulator [Gemmatimonadales bacterium]NIQ99422.1 response regulator [Gemmatimonadales bacterium]NIS64090.1 response regulator [Gemmatimonadales bacterium]